MEKTWPEGAAEQVAYEDWQYAARNGETLLGFRAWLQNNEEEG